MVHLKLIYFNIRARGEPIRLMLHYAGIPFEDELLPFMGEEWAKRKDGTPFGKIPILEIDGKVLAESWPIYRYVARITNLTGKDSLEEAFLDQNVELVRGWIDEVFPFIRVALYKDPGDEAQMFKDLYIPITEKYFSRLEKQLKAAGGHYFGSALSWADFVVAPFVDQQLSAHPDLIGKYTGLVEHSKRILALPELQHYLKTRKV